MLPFHDKPVICENPVCFLFSENFHVYGTSNQNRQSSAERFLFHKRDQVHGELIEDFVIELSHLERTCNFGSFLEEALSNCLVCEVTSSSIQKKLLTKKDLTLQRAINIATAAEMALLDHQQEVIKSPHREMHSVRYMFYM